MTPRQQIEIIMKRLYEEGVKVGMLQAEANGILDAMFPKDEVHGPDSTPE